MPRRFQLAFIGCFLLIIYGVPLSQAGLEMYRGGRPQAVDVFAAIPTKENLRVFEKDLERASVYAQQVRPWMQYLTYLALRNPGEKAILGSDGWLFYKPDVQYLVEQKPMSIEDPVTAILAFREELARRGIRLMIIPMPGKPSVYPEKLTRRNGFRSPTRDWIARLRVAGVETPDLFEIFATKSPEGPYYLRRDTHWSGDAARIGAGSGTAHSRSGVVESRLYGLRCEANRGEPAWRYHANDAGAATGAAVPPRAGALRAGCPPGHRGAISR